MSLASPWWLLLLVSVPFVVLLHLTGRSARRIGSTLLWRSVVTQSSEARMVRPPESWWRLIAHVAIIILLALALAQPSLTSQANMRPLIVLLDAGVSMAIEASPGVSRFEWAVDVILEEWNPRHDGPVTILAVGSETVGLVSSSRDHAAVRTVLEAARPFDVVPDWPAAFTDAVRRYHDEARLMVLTADPSVADVAEAYAHTATLDLRSFAAPFANLSIVALELVDRDSPGTGQRVRVAVRAVGFTPGRDDAYRVELLFRPNDARVEVLLDSASLAFSFSGLAEARFDVNLPVPGYVRARITPASDYPADDARSAIFNPDPVPTRVLVVTPTPETSPTVRALEAMPRLAVATATSAPRAAEVDVVFFEGAWTAPDAASMSGVDTFVWLGSAPSVSALGDRIAQDPGVAGWDALHPAVGPSHWTEVDAAVAYALPPVESARTLVEGIAVPLVQFAATSSRRDVMVSFDPFDQAWSTSNTFITFLHDTVDWLAPPASTLATCRVAVTCLLPFREAREALTIQQGGHVIAAFGEPHGSSYDDGRESSWVPTNVGVATLQTPLGQRDIIIDPAADVVTYLRWLADTMPAEVPEQAATARRDPTRVSVAALLAILVAALMVAESVTAGLRRQRYFIPTNLRMQGLSGRRNRRIVALIGFMVIALLCALLALPTPMVSRHEALTLLITPPERSPRIEGVISTIVSGSSGIVQDVPSRPSQFDVGRSLRNAASIAQAHEGPVRLLIVTDHDPTVGDVGSALSDAHLLDVPIDIVFVSDESPRDILVERLDVPDRVRVGDHTEIVATLFATYPTRAEITVGVGDADPTSIDASLERGRTLLSIPIHADTQGDVRVTVSVSAAGDDVPGNDKGAAILRVVQPPQIQLFSNDETRAQRFANALELQGMRVTLRPAHAVPPRASLLYGSDGVILFDTPALALTSAQQGVLESWVRDHGGGLVVTGGTSSFGAGGYVETILDRLLPVSSMITRDRPEVAVVVVLDRSGSMQQSIAGVSRLAVAKQATMLAVELLGEGSQVAIIGFDEHATLVLPFTPTDATNTVERALAPLIPGGGTAIHPGLRLAVDVLSTVPNAIDTRHVIVLTDGLTRAGDFPDVIADLRALNATVSAIAIGVGADVDRVQQIAELGGGTAHVTTDFLALPSIMAQEALQFSEDAIVDEPIIARRTALDDALMVGIPERLPILGGLVETTPKLAARVHLVDEEGRPVLATWRYGAGSVMAFTSDPGGAWAEAWTQEAQTPARWAQWVRSILHDAPRSGLDIATAVHRDELIIRASVTDETGAPRHAIVLDAFLQTDGDTSHPQSGNDTPPPGSRGTPIRLREISPGRFEASTPLAAGTSIVTVEAPFDDTLTATSVTVHHSYPASIGAARHDLAQLQRIVDLASASMVRTTSGSGVAEWRQPPTFRLDLYRSHVPWLAIAGAAWLAALLIRYGFRVPPWRSMRSIR